MTSSDKGINNVHDQTEMWMPCWAYSSSVFQQEAVHSPVATQAALMQVKRHLAHPDRTAAISSAAVQQQKTTHDSLLPSRSMWQV